MDAEQPQRARPSRRTVLRGGAVLGGAVLAGGTADAVHASEGSFTSFPYLQTSPSAQMSPHFPDRRLREARVVWQVATTARKVALTFDDGPLPDYTAAALAVLHRYRVRATFNLVGRRLLAHPELARRQLTDQHELGNHTFTHANLPRRSPAEVRAELHRTHEAITRLTGREPRLFRPPYGNLSGDALRAAGELGYDVIGWSVQFHEDLYDAAGNASYIATHLQPGSVVLAHDTGNPSRRKDVEALPALIRAAWDRGFEFVTVSELLAEESVGATSMPGAVPAGGAVPSPGPAAQPDRSAQPD